MENSGGLLRFLPTLDMVAEAFVDQGWPCRVSAADPKRIYRGVRLYKPPAVPEEDILYLLTEETAGQFPADRYPFVSLTSVSGNADHILCPGKPAAEVLELLMELFGRYREQEARMDRLVLSYASLDDLCNLGRELTGYPFCIHDDWFIIIAMSYDLPQVMPPENVAESNRGFIPRKYIDSFKNNEEYARTYASRQADLWHSSQHDDSARCLYANLWEGDLYRGRLLILENDRPFRKSDYLLADCLAQRAMLILQRQKTAERRDYRSMDDIAGDLLEGKPFDTAEANLFLDTLHWRRTDRFLCVRLQTQQADVTPVMDHMLHSELFQLFPDSYILFVQQQQCVILNLSHESIPVPQVRHRLAAVCRDYYLYAGISAPVWGVDALRYAYRQTKIALEQAFFLRNERWVIPFPTIVLDYALRKIPVDPPPGHLAAPELLELLDYDRQKGTDYFGTLRAWLLCERDIPRTSEALIIHRTTLLYRLKKILSLTGLNLDDPDQRLYLLLSLKLLEQIDYRGAPEERPRRAAAAAGKAAVRVG